MVKNIIAIMIALIFLSGCSLQDNNEKNLFTGSVEGNKVNISSEINGKLIEIDVEEGNKIQSGDRIALIDADDLRLKLNKAERALELSEAKLQEAINGARNEEVKNLKSSLNNIEVQLDGAKKNYDYRSSNYNKILKLYENSAASQQQVDDAKALLDNEATKINSLEKQYDGVKAQLDLMIAGVTDQKLKMIESEVEMAKTEVDILKNQIEKAEVKAPIDGVMQNINFNKGELINQGGTIGTIIDDTNLWIKIYIPENQLHKISLGDKLKLNVDFLEDEEILGEVIFISNEAEFTPKNVESKESKKEMVFETKIKIINGINKLKPGMLVDVILEGDK